MFQFKVKGSALKNLLSLHAKSLQSLADMRESFEREQEEAAAKDAEVMQSLPPHLKRDGLGYGYQPVAPVMPLPVPRSPMLKAMNEAATKHGIALNRWFSEQLQDDEVYTITSDDLRIFGLTAVPPSMLGGCGPHVY